jgi:hypothetical protein
MPSASCLVSAVLVLVSWRVHQMVNYASSNGCQYRLQGTADRKTRA